MGFEVSTATGFVSTGFGFSFVSEGMIEGAALASDWRFRFCQLRLESAVHGVL